MLGFGELESRIMICMWTRSGPATVREVLQELSSGKVNAYTTVMTVMDNLHRKGWLRRERDGRAYRYEPTSSRAQYVAELMRDVLGSATDQEAALVHFTGQLSADEAAVLRRALQHSRHPQ